MLASPVSYAPYAPGEATLANPVVRRQPQFNGQVIGAVSVKRVVAAGPIANNPPERTPPGWPLPTSSAKR